jgi:RNA polymerase sigma-70 factor (ECF subfamily)
MLYVEGYKYEEIAEILGIPVGTVKSRIFTARERLKAMLGDIY